MQLQKYQNYGGGMIDNASRALQSHYITVKAATFWKCVESLKYAFLVARYAYLVIKKNAKYAAPGLTQCVRKT